MFFKKHDVVGLEDQLLKKYEIREITREGFKNFCNGPKGSEFSKECEVIEESFSEKKQTESTVDSDDKKVDQSQNDTSPVSKKRKISFDEIKQEFRDGIALSTRVQMILNEPEKYFISEERKKTYLSRKKKIKEELIAYKKENNLLTRDNITFLSLLKGQFTHADYWHLFGNLLSFIFFAIYLEARLGALLFSGVYFLTGTAGLFINALFLEEGIYLLGASANVLGVVGAFYILFFKHYFKMYFAVGLTPIPKILCFSKTFLIKMKFAVPVFFVLGDVSGLVNPQGSVAHLAHIGGFVTGVLFSLIVIRQEKVKWPFIYPSEFLDYNTIQGHTDRTEKLEGFSRLLRINPMNKVVQKALLDEITSRIFETKKMDDLDMQYLLKHTEPFVGRACFHQDYESALEVLKYIPLNLEYSELLQGLSQKQILRIGDSALEGHKYFLALKLYDHFLYKSKKRKTLQKQIIKTISNIFDHIEKSPSNEKKVLTLIKSSSTKELYLLWLKETKSFIQQQNIKVA